MFFAALDVMVRQVRNVHPLWAARIPKRRCAREVPLRLGILHLPLRLGAETLAAQSLVLLGITEQLFTFTFAGG